MSILKRTNKQKVFLTAVFIFMLAVGFGLGKVEKASAAETGPCYAIYTYDDPGTGLPLQGNENLGDNITKEECTSKCTEFVSVHGGICKWRDADLPIGQKGTTVATGGGEAPDVCGGWGLGNFFNPKIWFNCFLLVILRFLGWVLAAVATLFVNVVDVEVFNQVLGSNKVIYETWAMVRDTLNIAFILVLLFSAFCTIFQIEKYNYKKILINLVLMALLVNFSFPIARVIIDFSNVIMYYFIKNLGLSGSATSIFPSIAQNSSLYDILTINDVNADTSFLLAAVVFTLIFLVTIFAVTLLMLIRMVVLALLVIFSSVAFVGSLVPFLSTHASKWWDNLFKYSFFGPIMIFMIVVSLKMMTAITSLGGKFSNIAGTQTPDQGASNIAAMAFFTLPIVILWVGMSFAKQMSIAGAGAITGAASKFITGALKTVSGANFVTGTWGAYRTRRKEVDKDSWRNRIGTWVGSEQDDLRGQVPGRGGRDAQLRYQRDQAQKVEAESKRRDTANATTGDLENLAQTGNRFERAAAIQELANRGRATAAQMDNVRHAFGETGQVFNQLVAKVKAYDPVAAFSHITDATQRQQRLTEHINSNQFDNKKINAGSFDNAEFMELMFRNNAISTKDIMDISKSSPAKRDAINNSLDDLVAYRTDATSAIDQNIHMARFAQTGEVLDASFANHVFSTMDQDSASRMTAGTVATHADAIAQNVNAGKYKTIIQNMRNNDARKNLNDHIALNTFPAGTNAANVQSVIRNDQFLNNL
jgi:hypothetical protein